MSTDVFKKVVNQYVEAFDKLDIELIKDMFASDATVEDPVGTAVHVGIDAIVTFYLAAFEYKPKLVLTDKLHCAGNSVAFSFDVIMGTMKISPIDVFELNAEGKVKSMRAYWGPENMG